MSCRGLMVREVGLSLGHLGGTLAQTAKEALAEGLGEAVGEGRMVGIFISSARRNETKKHPPSPRPLPIWRGCKKRIAEAADSL